MKIEFREDAAQREPKLLVVADARTDRVERVLAELERMYSGTVQGYCEDRVSILPQSSILRVWAEGAHVFCQTAERIYTLRARLYEMEAMLDAEHFVRISKCELVNKNKILRLDASLSGTVGVLLEGGVKTYTSRRYVARIKAIFSIRKGGER